MVVFFLQKSTSAMKATFATTIILYKEMFICAFEPEHKYYKYVEI